MWSWRYVHTVIPVLYVSCVLSDLSSNSQHLFFDQQVTTKFDLKGISTRVARAKGEGQTLWDADWVENFQTRLLVRAHHKK